MNEIILNNEHLNALKRQEARLRERRNARPAIVDVAGMSCRVSRGVYKPSGDSRLLIDNVIGVPTGRFLDVGCGCGAVSMHLSRRFSCGMAIDVNEAAVEDASFNFRVANIQNIESRQSDLFEVVSGKWDVICFNGPYDDHPAKDRVDLMFWDPGHRTKTEFFAHVRNFLKPTGLIYFGFAKYGDEKDILPTELAASADLSIVRMLTAPRRGGSFEYLLYVMAHRSSNLIAA
jgi:release factor glutamine methyltransferase